MEFNTAAIQVLIALIGIIGAGLSVFVGLKVALSETKKDAIYLKERMDEHEEDFKNHIAVATHPTREEINHIHAQITSMSNNVSDAHKKLDRTGERLEEKVDRIIERFLK